MRIHRDLTKMALAVILMGSGTLSAGVMFDQPPRFNFDIDAGYRQDEFHWTIDSADGALDPFATMKYENLRIAQIAANVNYSTHHYWYSRAGVDYGRILSGSSRTSLYSSNSPNVEFSRTTFDSGRGYVFDTNFGVGYKFISGGGGCWGAVVGGYSYSRQYLHAFHAQHARDTLGLAALGDENLSSKYQAQWVGPWVGVDWMVIVQCDRPIYLWGSGEMHWARFHGDGHLNYKSEYSASIRQRSMAYGYFVNMGADYDLCDHWSIGVLANYQQWSTRKGGHNHSRVKLDTLPAADTTPETFPVVSGSRLKRAKWISWSVSAIAAYHW